MSLPTPDLRDLRRRGSVPGTMRPLVFAPLLKPAVWGGSRLAELFAKPADPNHPTGESWELVDLPQDQSVVCGGPWALWTLRDLMAQQGKSLLGPAYRPGRFPLLAKWIDARQVLSVQVHPNNQQAQSLCGEPNGKSEAWVIVEAQPGACIYAGLQPGVDRKSLQQAIEQGTVEDLLIRHEVQPGDSIDIPAGTVHAIGAGVLLAEIQQPSSITYRLFDWNRLGTDGKPRELHLEEGLACVNFAATAPRPTPWPELSLKERGFRPLQTCEYFCLSGASGPQQIDLPLDQRCHVLMVIQGRLTITADDDVSECPAGTTILLPAARGRVLLDLDATCRIVQGSLP